ncbi:hypothetical protein GAYE_SCF20G4032 [Galdieria yellowstonensis]|uniref:snRNA-activating protein complex subunit 3 n=1 Tax=Galdieria yellowstonensis TaxID=3028027 RepID=A0AAV9IFE2_9RHOD|nr:hypothetical protein GAYE_SCF20G4032 [Galdieria yellowstonensis]
MNWNQRVKLEEFGDSISQVASEICQVLQSIGSEDVSNDHEESQLSDIVTTPTNTTNTPLQCEALSYMEKKGVDSLDYFSFEKLETQPVPRNNFFDPTLSHDRLLDVNFQSFCQIGVYSDKLQLQQEILCSLSCTLEDLYSEIFCCNATVASKLIKDFTQNFLFCFESVLYTRLETWGSNEYIRNFEDFIKRENLETRYDKDFLQELSVEEVQNVQLGKLAIRFGVPYVLLHLGDCEHKLVFKDLFADVCEEAQKVCKTVFLKPPKPRTCGACRMKNSVFVCHNHELADASPYFLCSDCYERIKLDSSASKTYELYSELPFE